MAAMPSRPFDLCPSDGPKTQDRLLPSLPSSTPNHCCAGVRETCTKTADRWPVRLGDDPMRRRLNLKLFAALLCAFLLMGVGVHFLHAYQVRRSASGLLDQATRAEEEERYADAAKLLNHYQGYVWAPSLILAHFRPEIGSQIRPFLAQPVHRPAKRLSPSLRHLPPFTVHPLSSLRQHDPGTFQPGAHPMQRGQVLPPLNVK